MLITANNNNSIDQNNKHDYNSNKYIESDGDDNSWYQIITTAINKLDFGLINSKHYDVKYLLVMRETKKHTNGYLRMC